MRQAAEGGYIFDVPDLREGRQEKLEATKLGATQLPRVNCLGSAGMRALHVRVHKPHQCHLGGPWEHLGASMLPSGGHLGACPGHMGTSWQFKNVYKTKVKHTILHLGYALLTNPKLTGTAVKAPSWSDLGSLANSHKGEPSRSIPGTS